MRHHAAQGLLETYLDRVHGTDWRGSTEQPGEAAPKPPSRGGRMSRDEALQMLDLKPGASAAEIKDAHRRLMMKVHPDKGGSDYLAAKLNEAKDVLLGAWRCKSKRQDCRCFLHSP